jgi:DNA modification methylase
MADFPHIIIRGELPSCIPKGAVLDIRVNGISAYTHGFHKYPGKFIPHIPRWAIRKYMGGAARGMIMDPFCGSGTTLVEGILAGYNVLGIDIDPLSVLISRVKTQKVDTRLLRKTANWLVCRARAQKGRRFKPKCATLEHWFSRRAIQDLGLIRAAIDDLPRKFGDTADLRRVRDIWLVCFSSIIRRASNADNQSQKTFVSHTHPKTPENAVEIFCKQISLYVKQMEFYSQKIKPKSVSRVIIADSGGDWLQIARNANVNLIVTSPPYIKAIDYLYNQMAELFWIGDLFGLETQSRQNQYKKGYIGSQKVFALNYRNFEPQKSNFPEIKKILHKICLADSKNGERHAFITEEYFRAIANHFASAARVLPHGKFYILVVGDCQVSGVDIDMKEIFKRIAAANGFRLMNWWGYKIKNRYMRFDRKGRGGIISHDWVLEMRRERSQNVKIKKMAARQNAER